MKEQILVVGNIELARRLATLLASHADVVHEALPETDKGRAQVIARHPFQIVILNIEHLTHLVLNSLKGRIAITASAEAIILEEVRQIMQIPSFETA